MQIAATSVAMEKEEKTLETLLTVPVDRFAILMGKVSSTIIVAGVAAVTVLIGYNYMLGSLTTGIVRQRWQRRRFSRSWLSAIVWRLRTARH